MKRLCSLVKGRVLGWRRLNYLVGEMSGEIQAIEIIRFAGGTHIATLIKHHEWRCAGDDHIGTDIKLLPLQK